MVLSPGEAERGSKNPRRGEAIRFRKVRSCLSELGDEHEICDTGRDRLRTLIFSAPPAYTSHSK